MQIDLLGVWNGTVFTDGLWFTSALHSLEGKYVGGEGYGGPPHIYNVSLEIKWQGDYQTFYYALVVSPFYGQLVGMQQDSIPVSGFINTDGFIKVSFYTDTRPVPRGVQQSLADWGFNGYVTTRGGFRVISGHWAITSWSQGILSYQLGTLDAKRNISLKERAAMILSAIRLSVR